MLVKTSKILLVCHVTHYSAIMHEVNLSTYSPYNIHIAHIYSISFLSDDNTS